MNLALIVGSTAAEEIAVANSGLEGRRSPEIERLGGLHVIMAVEENGGLAGGFQRFRVDEWVQGGGDDFNVFETGGTEIAGDPVRASFYIRLMLALGTDAGNAQKLKQFSEMLVAATINKVSKIHKKPSRDRSPFSIGIRKSWRECWRQRNESGIANDQPWPRLYSRAVAALRTSRQGF